jgi:eukaryotic-like serine/threonine-protein kinase
MASIQIIPGNSDRSITGTQHKKPPLIRWLFLLLLLGALFTAPVAAAPGWKFHADNQNTGIYDDGGKRPSGDLIWKFGTGRGVRSSPAVVDGTVYIGGNDGYLYALEEGSGSLLWKFAADMGIQTGPAVANGVVYAGGWNSNVYAVDAGTGALLWNYTTGDSVISSPAMADGIVYIGSRDDNLYAFNASTGDLLWNYTTGNDVTSSPAVKDGTVYFGSWDGNLYALDAATGDLLWNYTTGSEVRSSPAVANGTVYVGCNDNSLYALDASSGAFRWSYTTGGPVSSSPAVTNGIVYVGSDDGNLYALDASSGALRWNYATGEPVYSSPAVANGVVYAGSLGYGYGKTVHALDASTGALLWDYQTGEDSVYSSPAVSGGMVFIGSDDGNIYAFGSYPDEPPGSVTDLQATSTQQLRITWTWTDPPTVGFSHVMVYLNGVFQANITKGTQTFTATGLSPSATYTIGTRTVGERGWINQTWVNQTATTSALSLSGISPASVVEGSPGFTLDVYGTGFTPASTILWNGGPRTTQYIQPDHLSTEVPAEEIAYPRHVRITVYDSSSGESSNSLFLSVTDMPSDAKAWKFRSDIYNTGVYDNVGIPPDGTLLWNYTTGDGVSSSPVIVNGVIYVGSRDHNLYAINAATGDRIWNFTDFDNNWVSSTPAVADGVVYFGGYRNKVYALDAGTGALIWNYTVPSRYMTRIDISSSPAVANGIVYIGNFDGNLYAINAATGALVWNYTMDNYPGDPGVFSSPAVANGIVYIGNANRNLYALNAETGDLIWNYTTGNQILSSPAIADGVVYFGSSDKNLYALNAETGAFLWSYTTGGSVVSSPAISNGVVYVGSYDNNTYALNAETGAFLWSYTTGNRVSSSPAIADGVVYVGSQDNNLYALDAETGAFLWDFTTGGAVTSSPAVKNGMVYFGSRDKNLYALGSRPVIVGSGKGYYLVHSNVEGAEVYFNDWYEGVTAGNGTLLVQTCVPCPPVRTFTVKKCGYFALTQNNTRYPHENETIDLYANLSHPKEPLIADFDSNSTTGPSPLSVGFTSHSVGIAETWNWSFGDGTYSEEMDPVHTYTTSGVYSVGLTETNSACQNSTIVKPDYITVGAKPSLIADFTVSPVSGTAPLTVKCTDQSVGSPTRYTYSFGDGIAVTGPNPSHTYRLPGVYNISLTITKFDKVSGSVISSSITRKNVITVGNVPFTPPVAGFTAAPVNGAVPLTVRFTDQSTGSPTVYNYDFGDGVNMTGSAPVHTYRYPGVYTVTLTVMKNDASSGTMVANSSILKDLITVQGNSLPNDYVFFESDNNGTFFVGRNNTFNVYLEECGTCGYLWNLTASPGLRVLNEGFIPPDPDLDGGAGTHTWHIIADTPGQHSIDAIYKRPWEPATGEDQTYHLTIVVE